jgi:hypothetical protein
MTSFKEYMGVNEVKDPMLEKLAEIEHDQWMAWAKSLMESEDLSPERVERWKKMMVPYDELSDDVQEFDREYARKVLAVVSKVKTEGRAANQMFIQAKALKMLGTENTEVILALIKLYGAEFRKTIEEFEERLGILPTPDDLIWLAGVHTGKDPRMVAKKLIQELEK